LVFTLYSRTYCHLCDDMLAQLRALAVPSRPLRIEIVDVDADEEALARYDEMVPVLTARRGEGPSSYVCHYFLNEPAVLGWLSASGG
ncbi:MAG: glutaredoxin family protein, partial [Burkholderiaceae bacterium]